jgi:hypothetical protein
MRFETTLIAFAITLLGALSTPAQNQVSLTVDANMDIYRAGGYNDGSDGIAPVVFSFPERAWRTMTFPSVGGGWSCQNGYPDYGADGETTGYCLTSGGPANLNSVGRFSGYQTTDFVGGLVGVFLEDALPAFAAAALRFYVNSNVDGGTQTDFLTLSPKIGQVFFIGDGLTATGAGNIQTFFVPTAATHLYLGYVDNCRAPNNTVPNCYSDNAGSLSVTVRLQQYVPDWVEPTLSTAPSARDGASMAHDATGQYTLLFGGSSAYAPGVSYGDTWVWRGGWHQLSPAASPAPRGDAGMAYDPITRTVVLFGGKSNINGDTYGDTWTWDGVTWTQQFPPVSPPPRGPSPFGMVYDPVTETVLMFGGGGSSSAFGDTWEWNGRTKTWTQLFPSTSPSPRLTFLAYDALTKNVVLFGGENGVYYGDTWTWDGVTWTQQFPANSPSARTRQAIAYDASLGEVILFGGTTAPPSSLNDTWGWNGNTWKRFTPPNQPSARYVSSMVFDPLSDGLVLFGGETAGNIVTDETWFLIPVPIP